mmetsp:Transcript_48516/g.140550  ORF Transcript_48516/g.140550 Transcript_48516/m.140550 type:complete len:376 (-) Transcript_48516:54-1181(-)
MAASGSLSLSRHVVVAWQLAQLLAGVRAVTLREALLCEARERLEVRYGDKNQLKWPFQKDGVTMQLTKRSLPCGGNNIPLTFGEFHVDGATHIDVLNVLANTSDLATWEPLTDHAAILGDWRSQGARGNAASFVSRPFPAREFYDWQVFDTNHDMSEVWMVSTTRNTDELRRRKPPQKGAVASQNCLAAYRVRVGRYGGADVAFTTQVNSHPWLVSAEVVFNLLWWKTVDHYNGLRARAQQLAKARGEEQARLAVPSWMLEASPNGSAACGGSDCAPPFASCLSRSRTAAVSGLSGEAEELPAGPVPLPRSLLRASTGGWLLACVAAWLGLAALGRRRAREQARRLGACGAACEEDADVEQRLERRTLLTSGRCF